MGKSTINGVFSTAMLVYQRVSPDVECSKPTVFSWFFRDPQSRLWAPHVTISLTGEPWCLKPTAPNLCAAGNCRGQVLGTKTTTGWGYVMGYFMVCMYIYIYVYIYMYLSMCMYTSNTHWRESQNISKKYFRGGKRAMCLADCSSVYIQLSLKLWGLGFSWLWTTDVGNSMPLAASMIFQDFTQRYPDHD